MIPGRTCVMWCTLYVFMVTTVISSVATHFSNSASQRGIVLVCISPVNSFFTSLYPVPIFFDQMVVALNWSYVEYSVCVYSL